MKIGFFTDTYSKFGVEISMASFAKELEELGHEVFIFAPFYFKDPLPQPRLFRFLSLPVIAGAPRLVFPFLPAEKWQELLKLKLDVCHIHTPFAMGMAGILFGRRHGIPVLYTNHIDYVAYAKVSWMKIFPSAFVKLYLRFFANRCSRVIAPSRKIENMLKDYGAKKPIAVLSTGINLKAFKKLDEAKKALREKLQLPQDSKILLYVGRLTREKNIEFLLKAFKAATQKSGLKVIFLLVGGGPYEQEIKERVKNLEVADAVKFAGLIPHSEIPLYYQGSDIFVFASHTDTQGIVMLEAAASGLPILALKDEAFEGMVFDKQNGFLLEDSAEIFANHILLLLQNPNLYQRFSENSLKIVQGFSEESQTKKLVQIYETALRPKQKS